MPALPGAKPKNMPREVYISCGSGHPAANSAQLFAAGDRSHNFYLFLVPTRRAHSYRRL
jgi:hypothetical protein